ncbi:MAG: hypothetical protein HQM04_14335 [Magnetococcales bacterium]|nr:hypothetical protein [Magnetococcales bacterium]MBF0116203.1 hypothetical protein [Magnetococcales bacterium]
MTTNTVNLVEQIARVICRHDVVFTINETAGELEEVFTNESLDRAFPGQFEKCGRETIINMVLDDMVNRAWEEYLAPANDILKVIGMDYQRSEA